MSETVRLSNFASIANAVFNSVSANATAVTSMSVGGHTINATSFAGTANNANNLGGVAAASYALLAGPTFTGNTAIANLAITGLRITGDFSNATPANRLAFQASATNAATGLYVLPNGTSTTSAIQLFANSNPSNTSMAAFIASSTEVQVSSTRTGTGDLLPLTFAAGGSERMRITTNGDVGIGTTNPILGLGVFRDNGNGWAAWIGASAAGNRVGLGTRSSTASVQGFNSSGIAADLALNPDGGNVGIGTSSPGYRLTVVGGATQISPGTSAQEGVRIQRASGVCSFSGINADNNAYNALTFATSASEAMRITSAGFVGIGTSSPGYRLDVNGNIRGQGDISVENNTAEGGRLRVINTSKTSNTATFDWSIWNMTGIYSNGLSFWRYYGDGTNAGAAMFLADNGNVGIGTSTNTPAAKLQVATGAVNGTDGILVTGGTTNKSVMLRPSMGAGNNNNVVQTGDGGIIYDGGSVNTGAFVIAPWATGTSGMRMDSAGRMTRPSQPAFTAYGGSGITTTGSTQTCVFTATAVNIGSHYSTSTGRFTAPVAGLYHFTWFIAQSGGATGPVAYILVNGSSPGPTVISYGAAYNNACASVVLNLNANDFVTVGVIAFNSSFSFVDFGYSGFSGFLI